MLSAKTLHRNFLRPKLTELFLHYEPRVTSVFVFVFVFVFDVTAILYGTSSKALFVLRFCLQRGMIYINTALSVFIPSLVLAFECEEI